ncbi:MAG: hypothetical protein MO852_14015, partial [Candidatus Devosia euplotis]|nr:hypothetical protein [Candidatus Devosia euplotis]
HAPGSTPWGARGEDRGHEVFLSVFTRPHPELVEPRGRDTVAGTTSWFDKLTMKSAQRFGEV